MKQSPRGLDGRDGGAIIERNGDVVNLGAGRPRHLRTVEDTREAWYIQPGWRCADVDA
jgi:hypothetical protein